MAAAACDPSPPINATFTISTPGQNPEFTFNGVSGKRIFFDVTAFSVSSASDLLLYAPSGQLIYTQGSVADFEPAVLEETGTFRLVLDGYTTTTGTVTLAIRDASPFTQGSTSVGGQANYDITAPGLNPGWTFSGTSGSRVFFDVTAFSVNSASDLVLYAPSGRLVYTQGSVSDFDADVLDETGTFRLVLDGYASTTGTATLTIRNANPFNQGSTSIGGQAAYDITAPGLNPAWTFSGTSGGRVFFDVTAFSVNSASDLVLYAPSGRKVYTQGSVSDFDANVLDETGTFRLVLDGYASTTGTATLTIRNANPFNQGSTSIGGQANFNITAPGLNPAWTFSGVSGTRVRFDVTAFSVNSASDLVVYAPSGRLVYTQGSVSDFTSNVLDETGTFRLVLDGYTSTTGTATVGLSLV